MTATPAAPGPEVPTAIELDRAYVFHSWSAQDALAPMTIAGAEGCEVWDETGRRFLDFSSQLVNTNIGHQHPDIVEAIVTQARTLTTVAPGHANLTRGLAARAILSHAPASMSKVFFTNGGADANENAIRMARLHTGRDKVVSGYRSYHGNTGAAIVATGDWRRQPNEFARGHVHVFTPYLLRSEFWATTPEQERDRALEHLERVILAEGPTTIAAILLESVPGTAGILVPPPGYLAGVREIADRYGIVLILDEVMAGFGRTGRWFAFEDHLPGGVAPDLITFAKGVNSGYVPAGGVILSEEIASTFGTRVYPGGLTYSGHPLAMSAIVATIGAMERDDVVGNARRIGEQHLGPGLAALAAKHPSVLEVRGTGVFWAVELEDPLPGQMAAIKAGCLRRGLLPFLADNRIHVVPPCIVTPDEVHRALAILDEVLTEHEEN